MAGPLIKGTVVELDRQRGRGHVRHDASGIRYFFDAAAVEGRRFEHLQLGDVVTFLDADHAKTPRCSRVLVPS